MTRFTDGKRTIEITMETLSNHQSFEEEFYEIGGLEYDEDTNTYKVADVDYLVEQAEDMYNREGDYSYDERRTAKNAISVYVWDETNGCSMLDVTDTFELERWTDTYQIKKHIEEDK